jgi:PAS domain S-box-containing protein
MFADDLLRCVEGLGFTLLGAANVIAWRRERDDRRYLHLALALGLIGLLSLIGRLDETTGYRIPGLGEASLLLFLGSAYGLLEFRNDVMPYSKRFRQGAHLTILFAGALAIAVRFPRGEDPILSPIQIVAAILVILLWCASSIEPSLRFWRAARRLPTVQRGRVRALAFAFASIGGLLVVMLILGPLARKPWFTWIVHAVAIGTLPLLYASFSPPAWLRRAWRRREEETLLLAADDLTHYLPDRQSVAARGLDAATRLLGAQAGFVADHDGKLLASSGIEDPTEATPRYDARHAVSVPLRTVDGVGGLTVLSGPFTPLFGSDEVALLDRLARTVEIALDRVRLSHQVATERGRFESLLHAISDLGEGVVVTEGARVVYANDAYAELTGYSHKELAELDTVFRLVPKEDLEHETKQYRRRLAGQELPDHLETTLINKDGRRVEVEVAMKMDVEDGDSRAIAIVRDITARVASEDLLRQAFEREREAGERLRALDEMKNAFLTAVSHELRTPLTAVLGFAKTLEHQGDRITPEERRMFLGRLGANAEKLDRLLSDLLDVDRLSRGFLEPVRRPVDIGQLILRVAGESPSLLDRPIQVDAGPLTVSVDGPKVERIIENLLANAVRHTPPGTPIWIRAEEFERGVLIAVEDAGGGVSADLRTSLFEPFQQGPGVPDHAPGVGIGLSLVARFAELHGGRAWVQDRPGGGASFRVYLPGSLEPLLHSPS